MATSRSARYAKWLSIPLGLVISALLIWQASYAAFTATVSSDNNMWTTGTVAFAEGPKVGPLLTGENLAPGDSGSETISITYVGSLAADVTFAGALHGDGADELSKHITLEVVGNEGASLSSSPSVIYTGTLYDFATGAPRKVTTPAIATAGGGRQGTFKFTYEVLNGAPQGSSVAMDFTLHAESRAH